MYHSAKGKKSTLLFNSPLPIINITLIQNNVELLLCDVGILLFLCNLKSHLLFLQPHPTEWSICNFVFQTNIDKLL